MMDGGQIERGRGTVLYNFASVPPCHHDPRWGIVTVVHFLQEGVIGTTTEAKGLALVWGKGTACRITYNCGGDVMRYLYGGGG